MENKFRTIYDGGHFIDGIGFSSMEDAIDTAWDILHNWMDACLSDDPEGWDMMIEECSVWVEQYDEESGEWEEVWYPDDETLEEIGWVEHGGGRVMSVLDLYALLREFGTDLTVHRAVHLHDEDEWNRYTICYRGVIVGSELVNAEFVRQYIRDHFAE